MKSHCIAKANDLEYGGGGKPLLEAVVHSKTSGNVEGILVKQG